MINIISALTHKMQGVKSVAFCPGCNNMLIHRIYNMALRSRDGKPQIFAHRAKSSTLQYVPRGEWKKYADGDLEFQVFYKIPVLGTHGFLISDQDYKPLIQTFTVPAAAIAFYKQKLASYNARHAARIQRFLRQNQDLYNR